MHSLFLVQKVSVGTETHNNLESMRGTHNNLESMIGTYSFLIVNSPIYIICREQ